MQFNGTVAIEAPREKVWNFLTDPNAVGACAPGLQSIDIVEPGHKFKVVAAVGFGSTKVTFTVDVEWLELDAPRRAVMKAHGTAPGSAADVTSEMVLADGEDGGTSLDWSADVVVVGTIASLAARLMSSVTKILTTSFFNCVRKQIEV